MLKGLRVSTTPFQDIINEIWIGFNPNQILKKNMKIEDIAEVLYKDERVINKIKEVMKYNYSIISDGKAEEEEALRVENLEYHFLFIELSLIKMV